jgi:hypothetical protein
MAAGEWFRRRMVFMADSGRGVSRSKVILVFFYFPSLVDLFMAAVKLGDFTECNFTD